MERVTTLKEISRLSGYSVSTISKALNDKFDISLKTKKEIQYIAKKHNYVPNSYAIALRKQRTNSIAVILPKINELVYGDLLFEIEQMASNADYRIVVFQSFNSITNELKYLRSVNDGSVDGVILISDNVITDDSITNLTLEQVKTTHKSDGDIFKKEYIYSFKELLKKVS